MTAASREVDFGPWTPCEPRWRSPTAGYVRFLVQSTSGPWFGLFRSSELLDDAESLPLAARSELRKTFRWFNRHMRVPRRLQPGAFCWFRADADHVIEQMRVLIELYRLAGRPVVMQTAEVPGRIVYQDAVQIAAVPYEDRRTTASVM